MSSRSSVEVERSFALPEGAPLPDLVGVGGVAQVQQLGVEELDATYYDTEDLRLITSKATLRRRVGGRDAGWHLKLPLAHGAREEVTMPLGRTLPSELRVLVRSRTRGARLAPAVRIRTHRTVLLLMDAESRVLAEVAEDDVRSEVLSVKVAKHWHEVEVELVAGDAELLESLTAHLLAAGASVPEQQSKLGHALGDLVPPRPSTTLGKHPTAGDAVLLHLREQVDELVRQAPAARRDLPDGVHQMRVATRRLRSALKTYRRLLDRAVTDPVRLELKHLGEVLGGARDAEVMRARLLAAVEELPSEVDRSLPRARISADLDDQHTRAHARLVKELDSARFLALVESLDALLAAPPWRTAAQGKARKQLRACVGNSAIRLERAQDGADSDASLHEVRKAAKQARYAAESASAVLGRRAVRYAKAAKKLQDVLGEHQDSVVTRARLLELAAHAQRRGESSFAFGLMHAREELRASEAREAYPKARRRLRSSSIVQPPHT